MQLKPKSQDQTNMNDTVDLDIWEIETCRYWLNKSLSIDLTMTHLKKLVFYQACIEGKLHKNQFPSTGGKRTKQPLGLVHSDVCGKIHT